MGIYSYHDYLEAPFLAAPELGELLGRGSLRLFLGAGVSKGFGLPTWTQLIARVLGKDDTPESADMVDLENKSLTDQRRLLDPLDDGTAAYFSGVHAALYRTVEPNLLAQLQKSPLLLAVAAMMTGAHRGRVDSVVTYNYDDLLEQYLSMLGLAVCCRTRADQLSTRSDVEINHVHGTLPQKGETSGKDAQIVFSERSYRERRAEIDEGWSAFVEHGLYSKVGLFLGLSGDDGSILDILERTKKRLNRAEDYSGYWILTPDAFERNKSDILDVGMCPIKLSIDDIPQFAFRICQEAALR